MDKLRQLMPQMGDMVRALALAKTDWDIDAAVSVLRSFQVAHLDKVNMLNKASALCSSKCATKCSPQLHACWHRCKCLGGSMNGEGAEPVAASQYVHAATPGISLVAGAYNSRQHAT